MRSKTVLALTSIGLATAICLPSSRANACSQACEPEVRLFGDHTEVPGNLVYFKVMVAEPGPLSLRVVDGEEIPASIVTIGKDRVYAPDETIPEGTEVELSFQDSNCTGQQGQPARRTYRFRTTIPSEIDLRDPTLFLTAKGVLNPDAPDRSEFLDLNYATAEASGDIQHLIDVTASIDGLPADMQGPMGSSTVRVETPCTDDTSKRLTEPNIDTCGRVWLVPTGKHTVEVTSSIVGQKHDPKTVSMVVETTCELACVAPAGTHKTDPLVDEPSGTESTTPEQQGHKSAGGCSIGSSTVSGLGWLAMALGTLVRRRRTHG